MQQQVGKIEKLHADNIETYKAAREQYLKRVEESVDFVKEKGLTGTAKAAADEVTAQLAKAKAIPGYVLNKVQAAFEKLNKVAAGPAHKVLDTVKPTVDAAYTRYISLHDNVVASGKYKQLFDLSHSVRFFLRNGLDTFLEIIISCSKAPSSAYHVTN